MRTRNKIECCFGILKRRFPVLAYGCRLKLQNSLSVIVAVTVLHNLARDMNESVPDADEERDIQDLSDLIANGNIPICHQMTMLLVLLQVAYSFGHN
ncbi:hypothetical protein YQE_01706, partial [Dendroctonus ponderosae]